MAGARTGLIVCDIAVNASSSLLSPATFMISSPIQTDRAAFLNLFDLDVGARAAQVHQKGEIRSRSAPSCLELKSFGIEHDARSGIPGDIATGPFTLASPSATGAAALKHDRYHSRALTPKFNVASCDRHVITVVSLNTFPTLDINNRPSPNDRGVGILTLVPVPGPIVGAGLPVAFLVWRAAGVRLLQSKPVVHSPLRANLG
jgi:hypothetical protein